VVTAAGAAEYFDIEVQQGRIVLTPVRIQRGDAVRWARAGASRHRGHDLYDRRNQGRPAGYQASHLCRL